MLTVTRPSYTEMEFVLNRNKQENQGYFPSDHPIIDAIKRHDDTLQLLYNARKGKYRIVNDNYEYILDVPYDTLDGRLIDHIQRIDARTGYRAIDRIQEIESRIEQENERKVEDMAFNLAKDLKRPLQSIY
jgi:hypothetical protein